MAKTKDLADMDDTEFMKAWDNVGDEALALKQRLKEFALEHDRRLTRDALERRFGSLNDREREALAQYVEADGVESQEAVHNG